VADENKEPTIRIAIDIPMSVVEKLEAYANARSIKRAVAMRQIISLHFSGGDGNG
jgi:hypothetical protein